MELNKAIELGMAKLAELRIDGRKYIPSLDVYIKPSNHSQCCWICGKGLVKGERVTKEMSGVSRRGYIEYSYSHFDCYLSMVIHSILEVDGT